MTAAPAAASVRLRLDAVDEARRPAVQAAFAGLFHLPEPHAGPIVNAAPIVLLDGLAPPQAAAVLAACRPLVEAGATLAVEPDGDPEAVNRLAWPAPPRLAGRALYEYLPAPPPVAPERFNATAPCPACKASLTLQYADRRLQISAAAPGTTGAPVAPVAAAAGPVAVPAASGTGGAPSARTAAPSAPSTPPGPSKTPAPAPAAPGAVGDSGRTAPSPRPSARPVARPISDRQPLRPEPDATATGGKPEPSVPAPAAAATPAASAPTAPAPAAESAASGSAKLAARRDEAAKYAPPPSDQNVLITGLKPLIETGRPGGAEPLPAMSRTPAPRSAAPAASEAGTAAPGSSRTTRPPEGAAPDKGTGTDLEAVVAHLEPGPFTVQLTKTAEPAAVRLVMQLLNVPEADAKATCARPLAVVARNISKEAAQMLLARFKKAGALAKMVRTGK